MLFPPLALSDYFHLLLVCVGVSLTSVLSLVTVFSMRLTKLQLIKNKLKCTHVKLISGLTHVFCFVFFFKLYYLQIGSFQRYWLLIASTTANINFCQIAWLWGLRADLSLHAIVIVIQSANSCGKKEKTPWKLYKCKTSRIFFMWVWGKVLLTLKFSGSTSSFWKCNRLRSAYVRFMLSMLFTALSRAFSTILPWAATLSFFKIAVMVKRSPKEPKYRSVQG